MRNPAHLFRSRHAVYYFRWPLPKSLRRDGRSSSLKHSLETREPLEALRLARYLGYVAEIVTARGLASGMRYDELRKVLREHFKKLLEHKQAMIAEHGRLESLAAQALRNSAAFAEEAIQTGGQMTPTGEDGPTIDNFIALYSLPIQRQSPDYEKLRTEFKYAFLDYCRSVLEYDQSLSKFGLQSTATERSQRDQSAPVVALADLAEKFSQERQRGRNWTAKTAGEREDHVALLCEILDPKLDVRAVTPAKARQVKDTLLKYPKNRNKKEATRGLSLEEALSVNGIETLGPRTVNKYLQTYTGLFQWAKQNGYVDANVFDGMSLRINNDEVGEKRTAYTPDQVHTILKELLHNERKLVKKDYQKWGPLIAFYSGARLNEISQLQAEDIREENGVLCFDLNDVGDRKRVKTATSRRLVPVHPKLIELGLLDYVESIRAEKKPKLFPTLTYCEKNGWGRMLGRWFNENLLPGLGLKSDSAVFHSIRHTVVTRLKQAKIEAGLVSEIVGHAKIGVTDRVYYAEGYPVEHKLEALQRLPY